MSWRPQLETKRPTSIGLRYALHVDATAQNRNKIFPIRDGCSLIRDGGPDDGHAGCVRRVKEDSKLSLGHRLARC